MTTMRITETVEIDLNKEMWCCSRCNAEIHTAREPYLKGCLVYERPAEEIYGPSFPIRGGADAISYAADPDFMRVIEFYCPHCGAMITVQYLPPGHPVVPDIQLDIDKLKAREAEGEK